MSKHDVAKFLGVKYPAGGTYDEWTDWERKTKKAYPLRYFLAFEALRPLEAVYYTLESWYYNIRRRLFSKYHLVDSGLNPYHYHDKVEILLHSSFSILKDYVEIELAWQRYTSQSTVKKNFFQRLYFRDADLGVNYLTDWMNDDSTDELSARHAKMCAELYELYDWWVNIRPNREDPYDFSYEKDVSSSIGVGASVLSTKWKTENPELSEKYSGLLKQAWKLEEFYNEEDQSMLHRLVDIRQALWT